MSDNNLPVIVLGSSLTAVGVIRSLVRAGVQTYSACPENELPTKSRWYRPSPRFSGRSPIPAELPEYLKSLPFPRAVLIACSDDWAVAVAELPQDAKDRFFASVSSPEIIEDMTDKWRFARVLQEVGVPHPQTTQVESMEEMSALPERCYEGMFLKPLNSQQFSVRYGVKAFQIHSKQQALETMRKAGDSFPILLQHYIPGPPTNHYFVDGFVDRHRRISTLFARRRLRMFPPLFGNSTLMETVPLGEVPGAIDTLERMWSAIEYRGIFSAEFKRHDKTGEFMILEVNARPWWFIEFATRCGINVSHMSYRDAQDLPVEPVDNYPIGKRCVYLLNDLAAYRLTDPGMGGVLRWLRSWNGAEHANFCWDDPAPALISNAKSVARILRGKRSK